MDVSYYFLLDVELSFCFCFINILASIFSLQCIILCSIASFLYIHLLHCSDVNVWNLREFSSFVLQLYSRYLPYFISCYDRLNIVVHLTVGLRWLFFFSMIWNSMLCYSLFCQATCFAEQLRHEQYCIVQVWKEVFVYAGSFFDACI